MLAGAKVGGTVGLYCWMVGWSDGGTDEWSRWATVIWIMVALAQRAGVTSSGGHWTCQDDIGKRKEDGSLQSVSRSVCASVRVLG